MRTETNTRSTKHPPVAAQQPPETDNETNKTTYKVIRRNGKLTAFSADKISIAMTKAFLDVEGKRSAASTSIRDKVIHLTQEVVNGLFRRAPAGGIVHIEDIQDHVELALMRSGEHKIARSYVLYREQRAQQRAKKDKKAHKKDKPIILHMLTATGERKPIDTARLKAVINEAAAGLKNADAQAILKGTLRNLFDDIPETEVGSALVMSARTLIDQDPDYSYVTARLLLDNMRTEALSFTYTQPRECTQQELGECYSEYFGKYIKKAVELQHLDEELTRYDLKKLGAALQPERDLNFTYLGLQTLYDRYFIHHDNTRFELPQAFFMRVAMGLAINEVHREERTIEFYKLLSSFRFMSSTPTLFNSGSLRPQLSSCYLTTVPDDLAGIYDAIKDNALLSKFAGGLGNDWTPVRGLGSHIKGTNGQSQGVVPFLKVVNDTAVAVNQCFAADTWVYTAEGTKKIKHITQDDLVLGQRGEYRQVKQKMLYNQTDPMVKINVKHSITPLNVTTGHPLWALQSVPMQATARTMSWLEKGKVKPQWVDAGELQKGDYIAQVIPKETIPVADFTVDDARLYGILLGDGHSSREGLEWGVSGNPDNDAHLDFVQNYLIEHDIHYWVKNKREKYMQIGWSAGFGLAREATTGQFIRGEQAGFIFSYDELYNAEGKKHIHRRFNHLPKEQTLALIHGLIETDGNVSRGTEITFTNTSQPLVDGLRYQLLRLGVPCSGQYRERKHNHTGQRANGEKITFNNTTKAYDLRIPAIEAIAKPLGCKVLTKQNWLEWKGCLFSRLRSVETMTPTPFVYDLKVEGDASYMTTNGLAHNGGKRKGAVCAYLETWHIDIEDFLELRKNTGDERRRTHDMNSANWIPDYFMKRVANEQDWTLFSPDEAPDLHDLYGKAFEKRYIEYEAKAARGEMRLSRTIKAVELWRKMLGMLFETGHPWLCFSEDTKVAVADGREPIEIKELAESTKKFPVYSARPVCESTLNFNNASQRYWIEEIKMATAFKSGTRSLVKIYLDDGSSFRCTEDHLLALKDGGYVRADEAVGLSLCPFNRWQDEIRPNNRYIGRNKDPRQRQANMIWNFYNGDIPKGYVVDHIKNGEGDFIDNLQLLTIEEHNKKTSLERTGENNPFYGKTHSEEARKKISENTKRLMTEEYKQYLSNKSKGKKKPDRYGLSNPELIIKGREFYNKYNTLSNRSWRKHYKSEGLPSAGYVVNRFKQWSDFTDSCIHNHKVVKVENTGKTEDVYDLSVEDNHNFFIVTNETDAFKSGVLVHNCFKDPCNVRYSNQHVGVVHSSNLCTEITLHTDADEIAVCFPKGTQILTQHGQKPIESCDQEQVLVPFNNDLFPQQRFLTATLIPQGKKQVYEIITKNGITICATEEHPFLIQQPVNHKKPRVYEWRKLKELEKGDFIVCPLTTPLYDDIGQQDADFTAAGWMLGDGWMSSSYGACFAPHEITAKEFVLPILERWHQESPLGNNTPHSAPPTPYTQPNGVVNWHTQRQGFIDYVNERFGFHRATGPEKQIALQIKQAPANQIASFLSGLFSADGCIMNDVRRKKGGVAVNLSSASLQLLCDVQLLLKPFGIHGRVRGCSVKGRESRWQGVYEIKSRDSLLNFTRFIGFSLTPNKQEKLQQLLAKLSNKSAFQHSAVVNIVAKGEEEVFDLSLAKDHSFIANGLVVHNCNLGSVNLAAHTTKDGLDMPLLEKTITTATRMLDNVIEYNYYSVPQARRSNMQHRPVGLGLMGFQDALYKLNIPYATEAAVEFADRSMEAISYYAIQGSNQLAKERGKYSTYDGSLWSRGILPIDSLELMEQERGEFFQVDRSKTLDWDDLRENVKQHGMRNSNVMAIAPTACVSGNTLILSSEGLLPIESMAEGQAQWQTININIAQEGNLAHADQLYLNGFKETLRVTTKRGSEITATPNHRIRVINQDGDYVWKYFSELAIGDEVVRRIGGHQALLADKAPLDLIIPERQHPLEKDIQLPEKLTTDVAFMLGLYMGDGYLKYSNRGHYTKKEGIGFAIHNDETALTEHLRNYFSTWGTTLLADVSKTESACTTHLVFSSQLVKWFEANQFNKQRGNFGEGSASAFIPNKVLASNSEVLCTFLSGLFIADGTVNNRCVEVATVSRTLALQVKVALESLGILATFSTSKAGTKGKRPVYRVRTSNIEATRLFLKYIGFSDSYKHQYLIERLADSHSITDARRGHNIRSQAIISDLVQAARATNMDKILLNPITCSKTNGKMNINMVRQVIADYPALQATKLAKLLEKGDLYFEPIVSIEASEDVTYDLQVPEKHTYVANGFVSHNTISNICGVSQSIEPTYQNMYVKSNLSGEFTVVNPYLANELKALNLWDDVMINDLKYFDGSVQKIDRVPEDIKEKYATAFEIDSRWLIEAASRRQKWIDQGESLNLYLAEPSGKKLDDLYKLAWVRGLKTTYYLRTLAATHMEKSADSTQADTASEMPKVCSILDPDCEACQ